MSQLRYYKVLECEQTATKSDIKKKFKELAIKHHPDKGGDEEKFKEINEAYSILSDEKKRSMYDKFGDDGLKTMDQEQDISEMMRRREVKRVFCDITLEECFIGTIKNVEFERMILCKSCGSSPCKKCDAKGIVMIKIQRGPFTQLVQSVCDSCKGKKMTSTDAKCKGCHGKKMIKESVKKDIIINSSFDIDEDIILENEGDHVTETMKADVIIVFRLLPHKDYKVNDKNLILTLNINVFEALSGFTREVKFPSNKMLKIESENVINPTTKKVIKSMGLTKNHDLIISFNIDFPEVISKEQKTLLKQTFISPFKKQKKKIIKDDEDDAKECEIELVDLDTIPDMEEPEQDMDNLHTEVQGCPVQ